MTAPPLIPWQFTGNHWIAIPCVHPADGAVHTLGVVSHALRGATEFAGGPDAAAGAAPALLRLSLAVDGHPVDLAATRMAWQRVGEWLPTFNASIDALVVRGTVFAPLGRDADLPGFVYAVSLENRTSRERRVVLTAGGTFGACVRRVRTAQPCGGRLRGAVHGDTVVLGVADPAVPMALALAADEATPRAEPVDGGVEWSATREIVLAPGERIETAVYGAVAPEADGALAMLRAVRDAGWRALADATRAALDALQQATGVPSVDRLVNRHLVFAYFYAAARAIDDARWYLVRSRAPWNGDALTVRDWDALMWTIPAVQLADPDLARELLLRVCEVHGYAPGRGINYLDGTPFTLGFSLAAAAAYPVAVDRYVAQTGDDRVVEEPPIADALYGVAEDLAARRDPSAALYATERLPSGARAPLPYSLHANAVVALALDVLRQTLDEKTAGQVEEGDAVRAALRRHFALERDTARAALATAVDLQGATSLQDDPVGSVFWLPVYQALTRDDSLYRRTVRRIEPAAPPDEVAARCARVVGPEGAAALDWLRRAPLDNGVAAARAAADGSALDNGGDAALSGLVAYTVWYAATALGVAP